MPAKISRRRSDSFISSTSLLRYHLNPNPNLSIIKPDSNPNLYTIRDRNPNPNLSTIKPDRNPNPNLNLYTIRDQNSIPNLHTIKGIATLTLVFFFRSLGKKLGVDEEIYVVDLKKGEISKGNFLHHHHYLLVLVILVLLVCDRADFLFLFFGEIRAV